jgi:hypothetical protein
MPRKALLVSAGLVAVLAAGLCVARVEEASATTPGLPVDEKAVLGRFLARPDEPHRRLRALRRMRAAGLGKRAFMDVRVRLDPDRGLSFETLREGGSRFLRDHAFRGLLQQEQEVYASGTADRTAFTADNYALSPDGSEPCGLVRLRAVPRRRETALLDGLFLVTPDTADLVRAEGRLARPPSFWIPRVDVVRHYRRIHGQRLQVRLESVAVLRLFGEVRIVVDFDYEMVDGVELGSVDS